jgi:hypothetical protein
MRGRFVVDGTASRWIGPTMRTSFVPLGSLALVTILPFTTLARALRIISMIAPAGSSTKSVRVTR